MARGEGEIDDTRDVSAQSTERDFVNFETAKILSFSAKQGAEDNGRAALSTQTGADGQRMSALVIELERSVAAAAQASVQKPAAKPDTADAIANPVPETPPPPRAEARPSPGHASVSNGASVPALRLSGDDAVAVGPPVPRRLT